MGRDLPHSGRWARAVALGLMLGGASAPPVSLAEETPRRVAAIVSPDGRREAHALSVVGPDGTQTNRIAVANADGSGRRFVATTFDAPASVSWYGDDRLIVQVESKPLDFRIIDLDGREVEVRHLPDRCEIQYFALSPDGRQVVYSGFLDRKDKQRGQFGLFVVELATGAIRKLTEQNVKTDPAWSPDSTMVAVGIGGYVKDYALTVYRVATGESETLPSKGVGIAWSPDGGSLAFTANVVRGGSWLRGIPLDGQIGIWDRAAGTLTPVGPAGVNICDKPPVRWELGGSHAPTWSRDGRRIAFRRTESRSGVGLDEKKVAIWVATRDGSGARPVLDHDVDAFDWLADGSTLLWTRAGHLSRLDVEHPGEATSKPARPSGRYTVVGTIRDPDGKPIPGVAVRVAFGPGPTMRSSVPVETDAEGRYRIDFGRGMMGSTDPAYPQPAHISAEKPGYVDRDLGRSGRLGMVRADPPEPVTQPLAGIVYPDRPYTLDLVMTPATQVRARLTDPDGRPLARFRVNLDASFRPGNGVASAVTDDQGVAILEPIPQVATRFVLGAGRVEVASDALPERGPGDRKVHLTYDALDATLRWEDDPAPDK